MIHFKNHKNYRLNLAKNKAYGFTLVEALIALVMMGIIMGPLFVTEGGITKRVAHYSQRLQRIFSAHSLMIDGRIKAATSDQTNLEKKIDQPATTLKYQLKPVDKKSVLKVFENLYQESVEISYTEQNRKQKELLINFLYRPKPAEKKS